MAAAHRRLADLAAVHVRNAQAPRSSASDSTHVSACFVTLRRPHEAPFYITPPAPTAQASWGEYTSPPIQPTIDFAPSAWSHGSEILVGLYVRTDQRWLCIWETPVNLRTLPSLGTELGSVREFQPNLVYFGLRQNQEDTQLEYLAIQSVAPREPDAEEAGRRALLLSMVETQMQQSCTLAQALSVVHVQGDLRALQNTLHTLQQRCGSALTDNGLAEKRHQLESRQRLKDLRRRVELRKEQVSQARAAFVEARSALQTRRGNLERGITLLHDIRQRRMQVREASAEAMYVIKRSDPRKRAEEVKRSIQQHRVRLLRDLEFIYPIQLENARDLLYSIAGLALPNGVASTDERSGALVHKSALDESAAALAYVTQIIVLASAYLHIPLPYPLRPVGSRAVVQDVISVMTGPRTFALYGKGVEPYRYEYGVFLLNKDIEQLMHAYGVPMLDLRNTLPNVKNLLVTLASL
ncbi:hypothetical protein MBRA1_000073 [Malassezia brasiliensis]|uniref:Autophagy-related protein 14 n=1 Tax=Malassezia brasiliensis TaxID=1821822 RepID=A0AAF0IR17_9BASI|nr:hypothetical protein MBRA1_000073 [Malassezia brasiliensis]